MEQAVATPEARLSRAAVISFVVGLLAQLILWLIIFISPIGY